MNGMGGRDAVKNWWHYHKLAVLLIVLWLIVAAVLLRGLFAREKPDLSVGYVAAEALSPEMAAALEEALADFCEDVNGDGRTLVRLEQFALDFQAADDYRDMDERMANITLMTGSIYAADGASIFLLEDPDGFQRRPGALQYLDGRVPSQENTYDAANWGEMVVPWMDSALAGLELDDNARKQLERMSLGLCAPSPRDDEGTTAATERMWRRLIQK